MVLEREPTLLARGVKQEYPSVGRTVPDHGEIRVDLEFVAVALKARVQRRQERVLRMPGTGTGGPQVPQATLCFANRSRSRIPLHTLQRETPTSSRRASASRRNHACSKEMTAGACKAM